MYFNFLIDIIKLFTKKDAPISSLINKLSEYLFLCTMANMVLWSTLLFDTILGENLYLIVWILMSLVKCQVEYLLMWL